MPLPSISLTATGHRPEKLSVGKKNGYSNTARAILQDLARDSIKLLQSQYEIREIISGMALGWDTAVALAALELQIPLICAIPCYTQPKNWPSHSVAFWAAIRQKATEVHYISQSYTPTCMQQRNEWMVDRADKVLALWNGSEGGTKNCIRYAGKVGKQHRNVWPEWEARTRAGAY